MSDLRDEIAKQLTACQAGSLPGALTMPSKTYVRHVQWLLEANDRLRKIVTVLADAAATSIQADAALERVLDTEHEKEAADVAVAAGLALEAAVSECRVVVMVDTKLEIK